MSLYRRDITSGPSSFAIPWSTGIEDFRILQIDRLPNLRVLEERAVGGGLLNHIGMHLIPNTPHLLLYLVLADQPRDQTPFLRRAIEFVESECADDAGD